MRQVLYICAFLLASCSSKEANDLTLVCEGTEVTSIDNSQIKADVIKVKRTIRLIKQSVESKSGIRIINSDGSTDGDRIKNVKTDWSLQIDGSRLIIEESFKDKVLGKLHENFSTISVTQEKISAFQELRNSFELMAENSLNRYEKYSIDIDRISGVFRELTIEAPIGNAKGSVFRVETKGECVKSDTKF